MVELADEQETQDSRSYLSGYILRVLGMSCGSVTGSPAVEALQCDYHPDGIPGTFVPSMETVNAKLNNTQNSAGSAGMAAGGFFFFPLSHKIGRSSAIFWSLVLLLLSQVWASLMVHPDDFNGFIVSRFFGGALGTIAGVLGPRILVDMFFLHQRGRAFTVFHWCFDSGTVAGPTISVRTSSCSFLSSPLWLPNFIEISVLCRNVSGFVRFQNFI